MSQYKNNELEPRGWKIVVTSDEPNEVIEEEIDNMLRKISNRVRMDLCFEMSPEEVHDMFHLKEEKDFFKDDKEMRELDEKHKLPPQ